jgi:uncharacterized RDD family membrane protein YckC
VKCPKCGYLGFDSGERCRNCGYDFSLVGQAGDAGPSGRGAAATPGGSPPRDPRLARGARYRPSAATPGGGAADGPLSARSDGTPIDLPLFRGEAPVLPPPRAPLAVRRATPTPTRIRPRSSTPQPGAIPLLRRDAEEAAPAPASPGAAAGDPRAAGQGRDAAAPGRRAAAAAIDVSLVALIDLVVIHFTLALCGLTFGDLHVLPALPMLAFLCVLNGGYVVLFTGTLGQTFGKMATSIEVVSDRRDRMDLRRAALRGAAMVVSLLPAGIGWLAGLVGDHRSLHDRLAGTRVVRVADA